MVTPSDPPSPPDPVVAETFDEEAWLHERWRLFHMVVGGFFGLIAMVLGLILWVSAQPDSYHAHEQVLEDIQQAEAPRSPDGSRLDNGAEQEINPQQAEAPAPQ